MANIRKWCNDNDQRLIDLWGRHRVSEIAVLFGCSAGSIYEHSRRLGLEPPTGWRVAPIQNRIRPASFDAVANQVIAPGIEKHLVPLLHFRGSANLGRVHRLWNHTLTMMLHEIEGTADGTALSNHPLYSHLCEPLSPPQVTGLNGFWSRVLDKPAVADLVPGLKDYVRSVIRWHFDLTPVDEITHSRSAAWWRTYKAPTPVPKTKAELRAAAERRAQPKSADLVWPFIRHDHTRPANSGSDLVSAINSVVSNRIPEDNRADICQDLIMSILEGKFSMDDVRDNPKKYVDAARKMSPWKYEWLSLDAPVYGDEGYTLAETLAG